MKKKNNEKLYGLDGKLNIITYIRCKRLEWLENVWRVNGVKNKIRQLVKPRTRWNDSRKGYEIDRWKCNVRLDFELKKWRLTSGNTGS